MSTQTSCLRAGCPTVSAHRRLPAAWPLQGSDLKTINAPLQSNTNRVQTLTRHRTQAAAQQAQEAQPNVQNARRWIASWRSQATTSKAPDAKDNGSRRNGSTPANQPGQAAAPKAPGEAPPKAKAKSKGFNNINKFIVPEDKQEEFELTWRDRESFMQQMPGFLGFDLEQREASNFVVTSRWASIPEWEAYSLSEIARRSHLPWGVYQYVPAKGEGFPEDFVPFKAMDTLVNAKY